MSKTIKVANLVDKANAFFEHSTDSARMERIAVQDFVATLLLDTNTYAGFGYMKPYADPANDSSRIFFYKHHSLR